ncbi:arsenate reductase ArsC [Polynucleobacter sp. 15G-AUS-farblos]|uniref:arsenate reductase ArsC n=1 Tax=Polynucleobacter sp. 15G-AUS-farblos TaxID=2689094 RepID=UPI001C0B3E28|nr:arsenate reductase ArsC [Polynucleobacter sp. 15G-AUS-farblos]MBU3584460.1 arsenate reductase ArsC [Polynucleobacter sp. 15G-AUS-farblos]
MSRPINILFISKGNSVRSILGEALATTLSHGRFIGYSAGTRPKGYLHPFSIKLIREWGYPLGVLRSKSWHEFGVEGAPHMDFIITLCDSAAGEECPYWPGHPSTTHWGFADPTLSNDSEEVMWKAFRSLELSLRNRIELLLDLPADKLDTMQMQVALSSIHTNLSKY